MDLSESITILRASKSNIVAISNLVKDLLFEIMDRTNTSAFNFDLEETITRLDDFITHDKNFVFIALDKETNKIVGFVTVYEGYALYAEGAFGTMAELYVVPSYRSNGIGKSLIQSAKEFGNSRGWKRLEVTTPPLPQFDATLAFYEREGFEISGGRKLKTVL